MKKLKLFALATVAFLGFSGAANAETVLLASDDFVGISFWIIAMGMAAATVFFFMERGTCLLYTSPSPRDQRGSRMPSSA